ncbi:hypothetical protein LWI29_009861 [Acer saccharum]|uniref:Uncharacterized protein n=1 Tax=Acer saccharum TaxID=4024 RepID=A0AA39SM45_ACESA|nr:hypothetical protein LWI29_009861 [Acer saccharum]
MPAIGSIYGAMDKAKKEIAANLGNEEGAYKEIWKIIDEKWEFQLHIHLQNIFLKKKALKDDDKPLVNEYVPSDDEWMVGEDVVEGTSTDVDMSQPSGSHQVGEKRKRNTNK